MLFQLMKAIKSAAEKKMNIMYKQLTFGNKMASTSSYKYPFSNEEEFCVMVV